MSQPLWGGQGETVTATYVEWEPWRYPIEVAQTAAPNTLMAHGKPENRTAASLLGFQVRLLRRPGSPPPTTHDESHGYGVYGDTVKVLAAVVVLREWLPDETLLAIAEENNYSETAFVVPCRELFDLRWFTRAGNLLAPDFPAR